MQIKTIISPHTSENWHTLKRTKTNNTGIDVEKVMWGKQSFIVVRNSHWFRLFENKWILLKKTKN